MFEIAHLYEDALREYDELELCYLETGGCCHFCYEDTSSDCGYIFWWNCALVLHMHTQNANLWVYPWLCLSILHVEWFFKLSAQVIQQIGIRQQNTGLLILTLLINLFILLQGGVHSERGRVYFWFWYSFHFTFCHDLNHTSLILLISYGIQDL